MFTIVEAATGESVGSVGYWERESHREARPTRPGWAVLPAVPGPRHRDDRRRAQVDRPPAGPPATHRLPVRVSRPWTTRRRTRSAGSSASSVVGDDGVRVPDRARATSCAATTGARDSSAPERPLSRENPRFLYSPAPPHRYWFLLGGGGTYERPTDAVGVSAGRGWARRCRRGVRCRRVLEPEHGEGRRVREQRRRPVAGSGEASGEARPGDPGQGRRARRGERRAFAWQLDAPAWRSSPRWRIRTKDIPAIEPQGQRAVRSKLPGRELRGRSGEQSGGVGTGRSGHGAVPGHAVPHRARRTCQPSSRWPGGRPIWRSTRTAGRTTRWAGRASCRMWITPAGGGVWRTENALAPNPKWKYLAGASGSTRPGRSRSTRTIRARTRSGSARAEGNTCGSGCVAGVRLTRRPTAATTGRSVRHLGVQRPRCRHDQGQAGRPEHDLRGLRVRRVRALVRVLLRRRHAVPGVDPRRAAVGPLPVHWTAVRRGRSSHNGSTSPADCGTDIAAIANNLDALLTARRA